MNIEQALDALKDRKEITERLEKVLNRLIELLPNYQGKVSISGSSIDFDYPETREQVSELMLGLGAGKWEKSANPSGITIDYDTQAFDERVRVRIWSAPPPESCRIVEDYIKVPAQPERLEKRMKVVCVEPLPVVNPEPETEPSAIAP